MSYTQITSCPRCGRSWGTSGFKCWECGFDISPFTYPDNDFYGTYTPVITKARTDKIDNEEVKKLTGLSSSYYTLPEGCKELQDLIEYRDMNFARGNCFKAIYRMGDKPGTDQIYDWEKIIWFANREIDRLKKKEPK